MLKPVTVAGASGVDKSVFWCPIHCQVDCVHFKLLAGWKDLVGIRSCYWIPGKYRITGSLFDHSLSGFEWSKVPDPRSQHRMQDPNRIPF